MHGEREGGKHKRGAVEKRDGGAEEGEVVDKARLAALEVVLEARVAVHVREDDKECRLVERDAPARAPQLVHAAVQTAQAHSLARHGVEKRRKKGKKGDFKMEIENGR